MNQITRILIVDDYPMTIQGYTLSLLNGQTEYDIEVEGAHNCEEVLFKMKNGAGNFYNVVLLDIRLPPSKNNLVISGEDLGQKIRSCFPLTKIIIHTGLNDQQRISNIFKTLNPEGFLIKSDITPEILLDAVHAVLQNESYYSKKIQRLLDPFSLDGLYIDSLDRKILYYLSIGERTKNLPIYVPASMASIERRKKNLKILFGVADENDRELLEVAKAKGFI